MDGSVETHFAGTPEACRQMISWLERGPVGSRVDRVDATDRPLTRNPDSFEIIA